MNNRRLSSSRADSRASVAPRRRPTGAALFLGAIFFAAAACLRPVPAHALDLAHLMGFGNDDPTLETFKLIHVANLKAMMDSEARSGCGIMPITLRSRLRTPAMLRREPFGLSTYRKAMRSSASSSSRVRLSAK